LTVCMKELESINSKLISIPDGWRFDYVINNGRDLRRKLK
jgi:hypothetical protein